MSPPRKPSVPPELATRRTTPVLVSVVHQVQDLVGKLLGLPPHTIRGLENNVVWRGGVQVMRMDLHTHTAVSHDCRTALRDIPGWMLRTNTRVIAVTDHDHGYPQPGAPVRSGAEVLRPPSSAVGRPATRPASQRCSCSTSGAASARRATLRRPTWSRTRWGTTCRRCWA